MRKISRAQEQFSEVNFRTAGAWPSDEHYEQHIDELEELRHDTEKGVDWHSGKGETSEVRKHQQLADDLTRAIQDARTLEGTPRSSNMDSIREKGFDAGPETDRGGHVRNIQVVKPEAPASIHHTDLAGELGIDSRDLAAIVHRLAEGGHLSRNVLVKDKGFLPMDTADLIRKSAEERGMTTELPTDNGNISLSSKTANKYIEKRGDKWVIIQKDTGKVLSHHDSKEKAEASFRAMMQSKHGNVALDPSDWRNEYFNLDSDW